MSRARRTTNCWPTPTRSTGCRLSSPTCIRRSPVLLAIAHDRPGSRVVYVMSDQGALPMAFSRSVAELRASGLLAGTVTVGQAFGGDLEAVTLHSGLLAARLALGAELVVVSQGPGNLGTGTRWGFSGSMPARPSTLQPSLAAVQSAPCESPEPTPVSGIAECPITA